jgi:hypothetical protein
MVEQDRLVPLTLQLTAVSACGLQEAVENADAWNNKGLSHESSFSKSARD